MLGASFDYQQKIISCEDRFRTVVKPRQAGMTTAFAIEALVDSLIYDDYLTIIISPTKRQSNHLMRYIKKAFRKLEIEMDMIIPTHKFTTEEIFFPWGSEIYSLPNNPLGAQGKACDNGIIDEAALFSTNEGDAIMDAIVGSLAAKQGRLTISSRPMGKRGLLWRYWDPTSPKYKEFTHFKITWEDRAKEDKLYGTEVRRHKRILTTEQFDEIYNAEFLEEGFLVFQHELLEAANVLWNNKGFILLPSEGRPDTPNPKYIGIDFGRKRSLTEIHVLQKEEDNTLRSLMMKSLVKMNFEDQKSYIDDMMGRVRPVGMRIDERGMGLPLLDYLQKKHGQVVQPLKLTEGKGKEKVILQCRNTFLDGKIAIPYEETFYTQMHSYQKEYTEFGNVKYFGKVDDTDFQDDKVIALCAAVDAAQSQPFAFGIV